MWRHEVGVDRMEERVCFKRFIERAQDFGVLCWVQVEYEIGVIGFAKSVVP